MSNKLHPLFEQALAPFLKPVANRNGPERYQFGPFNSEDGTMSLMHPSLSPNDKLVKESAYAAKVSELEAALHEICGESTENNVVKIAEIALGIHDPTPWCSGCGARRKSDCHCGPIAENE